MHRKHAALGQLLSLAILGCGGACRSEATAPRQQDDEGSRVRAAALAAIPPELLQYPGAPFEASNGHLWFSTVGAGLVRFDGERYVTFTTAHGLADHTARGKLEDSEGNLWFGTTDGVSRYDGTTFTTVDEYGGLQDAQGVGMNRFHRDVWDMLLDSKGRIWITTLAGVFHREGTRFVPFPMPVIGSPEVSEFTPHFVYSIMEAEDGAFWFGTDGAGAVRIDDGSARVFTAKEHGLASDRVCAILEDSRGDLWFGTSDGGVSRYDGKTFTTHLRSEVHSRHTGWGRFMTILEDRSGNVWFGASSEGGGVYRWNGESFRYFSEADGLNRSGVPSLSLDRRGVLWAGTVDGVFRLQGGRFVPLGDGG